MVPDDENCTPLALMMLSGCVFEKALPGAVPGVAVAPPTITSIVVLLWPLNIVSPPADPVKVQPVTVTFNTGLLPLRESQMRLSRLLFAAASVPVWVKAKVVPVMVRRLSVPLVLVTARL